MSKSRSAQSKEQFAAVREKFIMQWGALGSQWGINRTMAMIHALLLVSPEPLSAEEVMEALSISRGNANTNLRDLIGWGLVEKRLRPGERKEFFYAEKDVWKIFCAVARERKRRETQPAQEVLEACIEESAGMTLPDAVAFNRQLKDLAEFVELANNIMERVAKTEQSKIIPRLVKLL